MEIIVTHRNADFDAIASQIAASKLYPKAVMIGAGGLPPVVRKFMTLHLDHFALTPVKEIDLASVTKMIVVDVRRKSRLKDFKSLFSGRSRKKKPEIIVYDHHATSQDDLKTSDMRVEPLGAATTLLVEEIWERDLQLTAVEATALALGIYADTGSLTYASTTSRDIKAVAFLKEQGASMLSIRFFLHAPLNASQRKILTTILTGSSTIDINSVEIGIVTVILDKPVSGLSEAVNEALVLLGNDAFFAFFIRGKNIVIIGRSSIPTVDVGSILDKLGGGGHPGAGSATLKKTSISTARKRFFSSIKATPLHPYRVRYAMSTPVYTVSGEKSLDDVFAIFQGKKISGAPVLRKGKLVGVISKRDIKAARKAGRSHLPVSSCMSSPAKTIEANRSLSRAFDKITGEGIGRLPVFEDNALVGIITRNDILRVVYEN